MGQISIGNILTSKNYDSFIILEECRVNGKPGYLVEFLKTGFKKACETSNILNGCIEDQIVIKNKEKEFLNTIFENNEKLKFRVLSKDFGKYYLIEFLDSKNQYICAKSAILSGSVEDSKEKITSFCKNKYEQNCGDTLIVLKKSNKQDNHKQYLYECNFEKYPLKNNIFAKKGNILLKKVENPNYPDEYGFFRGEGNYDTLNSKRIFGIWQNIKSRCLDIKDSQYKSYGAKGYLVCEEWHNFQNFAKWYIENESWNKETNYKLELDKDVLCYIYNKENKLYSPQTCLLIPGELNGFLAGDTLECGVCNRNGRYQSRVCKITLGTFSSFEEAKIVYARYKYKLWKTLIDKYILPVDLKNILLKYDFYLSKI